MFGLVLVLAALSPLQDDPIFERRALLEHEGEGAYAIPKLVVTAEGTAIVAFQDRRGGDWGSPIDPLVIRSRDGGETWSEPVAVFEEGGDARRFHIKPTGMVQDRESGRVFVFLVRSPLRTEDGERVDEIWFYSHIQETRRLGRAWFLVWSDDEGASWSEPENITAQLIKEEHWQEWSPVHVGVQLREGEHQGRLVVPVRAYCPEEDPSQHDLKFQTNGLLYSDDGGATWIPGARSRPYHGECSLVELPGGALYVNHRRSRGTGKLRNYSISLDGGESFAEHGEHADLPDQLCHAGLTRLDDLLVLSSVPGPKRVQLTASISADLGRTWEQVRTIEPGHAAYSTLDVLPDGTFLCVYETGKGTSRRDLALARFDRAWLEGAD